MQQGLAAPAAIHSFKHACVSQKLATRHPISREQRPHELQQSDSNKRALKKLPAQTGYKKMRSSTMVANLVQVFKSLVHVHLAIKCHGHVVARV
eukprot:1180993-Prorocentrum_minimum.AAC.6